MTVQLLGGVRIFRGPEVVEPSGALTRTLVAMLASAVGRNVPRERLIDALWADDPPASAVKTLQAHISKLRRVFEPDRPADAAGVLVAAGDGYRLDLDPLATDVGRFRAAAAQATCAADWREVVARGRGVPLAGCVDSWPVQGERRALEEEWFAAVDSWVSAELARGRPAEVLGDLERLVEEHPLRERLWTLLVSALDAAGRQTDALATYQRARRLLVDTAGVEPGPELRDAQQAVLQAEERPAGATTTEQDRTRRVPAPRSPLVGRDREVSEVARLVSTWRLITIVGPGGAGKTRLATEVARSVTERFPGGVVFVDLTSVRDPGEVIGAVAAATGVRLAGDSDDLATVIAARLRRDPTLLLIDGCEHVVGEAAKLVGRLLDEVEPLVALTTSRRPLGLTGEHVWPLAPLALDDAVSLFVQRAEARRPGAGRSAPEPTVRELCRRLDGLPLAVELAAARTGHLTVDEIGGAVAEEPTALRRVTPENAGDRHRSLEATIRWSYDLLDAPTKALLRRLAVFRGRFDRDQAAAVAAEVLPAEDIEDTIGELVAHSLVVAEPGASGTAYRLLDTIRAFAQIELDAHGETAEASRRHRDWYFHWAERLPAGSTVLDLSEARRLERHHADLLEALQVTAREDRPNVLAGLVLLASGLTFCPGGLRDAHHWLARAQRDTDQLETARAADLFAVAMFVAMLRDDWEVASTLMHRVTPLLTEHVSGAGPLVTALGMCAPDTAARAAEIADALRHQCSDRMRADIVDAIDTMRPAATLTAARDPETALEQAEATWAGRVWSDLDTLAAWTVHAALLYVTGQHVALRHRLESMERVPDELGPPTHFLAIFEALAEAAETHFDAARARLRQAWHQHWLGIPGVESDLLATAAAVHLLAGDRQRARRLLDRPGFRARHPGTATVHIHHLRLLDLPVGDFVRNWSRGSSDELSALLEDELDG